MLIADFSIDAPPVRATPSAPISPHRIAGYALSLVLHVSLLCYLLLPMAPRPPLSRAAVATTTMSLVLIDTPAPPSPVPITMSIAMPNNTATSASTQTARHKPEAARNPVPAAPVMSAEFIAPIVNAKKLLDDIEGAAAEIVAADPRLPNAGMPNALGQVPGRAEPFINLPLQHREGGLKSTLQAIAKHMILGGLPDDPLRNMAERSWAGRNGEPVCNDPENPLADERCWMPAEEQ